MEGQETKVKYPKAVFFIITNEFCERFCFYGLKTVLYLYLVTKLKYEKNTATVIYHSWAGFSYFFPIIGGIIADTYLGKFKTIVYLSGVYLMGNVLLSVVSITQLHLPQKVLSLLALFLVATGTGGIKPCVSSFGGEQFELPQQQNHLDKFFSFFYFSINAGSLLSTFITPILREDVQCFGEDTCFPAAFGVPAVLMLIAITVFLLGRPSYKIRNPQGNIFLSVCQCIWHALRNKTSTSDQTRNHWLDYADDKYSYDTINDIKILLRVLVLFIPLPLFWALFDQQGSRWTAQADQMRGDFSGTSFNIKADQMQVVNPFLILVMIPLFSYVVYPLIAKCGINTPLRKLSTGGLLAALSFIMSALLEFQIRDTQKIQTLRVYNRLECAFTYNSPLENGNLNPLDMITFSTVTSTEEMVLVFSPVEPCETVKKPFEGKVLRDKTQGTAYILTADAGVGQVSKLGDFDDVTTKSKEPTKLRILYNSELKGKTVTLESNLGFSKTVVLPSDKLYTDYIGQPTGVFRITSGQTELANNIAQHTGSVYVVSVVCSSNQCKSRVLEIAPPWVHMLWLLPQYFVITAAEIMFSITGLEFAFTQAPVSMKSVLSACWLLTVAFGNLVVVIVAEAKFSDNMAYEFLLFATLMILDMFVFMYLAMRYTYVTYENNAETNENADSPVASTAAPDNTTNE